MTVTNPGSYLELDDGRPAVRFERIYGHPIADVWSLVSEPDGLAHWFPFPEVALDLTPGGAITFSGDPHAPESQRSGRIVAVDAPRHLSFTWGGDELRFDLEPLGERRTRFTLTNVLEARDAAARNAAGWDVCLLALDARAAGGSSLAPHGGVTSHWERFYSEYVAAGMPSGAAVPGRDQ